MNDSNNEKLTSHAVYTHMLNTNNRIIKYEKSKIKNRKNRKIAKKSKRKNRK